MLFVLLLVIVLVHRFTVGGFYVVDACNRVAVLVVVDLASTGAIYSADVLAHVSLQGRELGCVDNSGGNLLVLLNLVGDDGQGVVGELDVGVKVVETHVVAAILAPSLRRVDREHTRLVAYKPVSFTLLQNNTEWPCTRVKCCCLSCPRRPRF